MCVVIYTGEIKIMSGTDGILWEHRELTWTTNVGMYTFRVWI